MTEIVQPSSANGQQPATETEARLAAAPSDGLQFMFGAQKLVAGEIAFAADLMVERAKTETHLLSELVSKLAGSHSVKDLANMYAECTQHQLDFVRRDFERLVKHGERVAAATSRLFGSQPQA
jgi:hypothetical protein